jgi:hypothetical protein
MRVTLVVAGLALFASAGAQDFTQKGYVETLLFGYPQTVPGDSGQVVDESTLYYEASYKVSPSLSLFGAIEAQTDSHEETQRSFHLSWLDRELRRPAFEIHRLSARYARGPISVELGRQLIRWGKADILNPTDRFAPRDFLNVVHSDFLPVTAARATWSNQSDSFDIVAVPIFTPSRTPLLDQRWGLLPLPYPTFNLPSRFPGGTQFGGRWNHIGKSAEYSLSYFDGFNHQPLLGGALFYTPLPSVGVQRYYPKLRSYGGDLAVPFRWVTLKCEAAYFDTPDPTADKYDLYVVQLERQWGEWSLIGGYAGEVVTRATPVPSFDFERGLARSFLARAAVTIDANRSASLEVALRENGQGVWIKGEYTQAIASHLRATAGVAVIEGAKTDFLGQFNRNSFASIGLRYSF